MTIVRSIGVTTIAALMSQCRAAAERRKLPDGLPRPVTGKAVETDRHRPGSQSYFNRDDTIEIPSSYS